MQWILGNVWFYHTTVEEVFLTPNTLCRYNEELKRVMVMKDLGVIFSSNFKFADNLTYLINKAKKKLGLVIRSTYDFKRPNAILPLFKPLVVPVLTYLYCSNLVSINAAESLSWAREIVHRAVRYAALKSVNPLPWIDHIMTILVYMNNLISSRSKNSTSAMISALCSRC